MRVDLTAAVLWKRRRQRAHEHWSRDQLDAHRARSLSVLLRFAVDRSPYWQRVLGGRIDVPLHEIPPLKKAMLMDSFDDVVTDRAVRLADIEAFIASGNEGLFRDRYWVSATSGSSGRRTDDVLWMPGPRRPGSGGDVAVHPAVFHMALDVLPINAWQVRQEGDALRVLLARPTGPIDSDALGRRLAVAVARTGADAPRIQIAVVDTIPAGAAGKRPHTVAEKSRAARTEPPHEARS